MLICCCLCLCPPTGAPGYRWRDYGALAIIMAGMAFGFHHLYRVGQHPPPINVSWVHARDCNTGTGLSVLAAVLSSLLRSVLYTTQFSSMLSLSPLRKVMFSLLLCLPVCVSKVDRVESAFLSKCAVKITPVSGS